MPGSDEHAEVLAELNKRSKGLWSLYPCELPNTTATLPLALIGIQVSARTAPCYRRVFLTYNSAESALEALGGLRARNRSNNGIKFLALLWHSRPEVAPVRPPGPMLTVFLGFHGTLNDVHLLFHDWPQEAKPVSIHLGKLPALYHRHCNRHTLLSIGYGITLHRLAGYVMFKSVEEAASAKLRLEAKAGPVYPGGPRILVAYYDQKSDPLDAATPEAHNRLRVHGLGPRATPLDVDAFFRPVRGLRHTQICKQ